MCDNNENVLKDIVFSSLNDDFNWFTNSSNSIQTVNSKLRLKADSSTTFFRRGIGTIDPLNNRVRINVNLDLFRPQTSIDSSICVLFKILVDGVVIGENSIYKEDVSQGEIIPYNLDRVIKYSGITGDVSLEIKYEEGFENELLLKDLSIVDYNYCDDNVRAYFVLKDIFDESLISQSGVIKLKEYKIDNLETLTGDFFSDTQNVNSSPLNNWNFAKADIDGRNRVQDVSEANTFNPFVVDFGLTYDVANSFHGGKPISVTNGKNYGIGIMNFGFSKPEVLNGELSSEKGAFFIDFDSTKDLKIIFEVALNDSSSVFASPNIYREYKIEWSPSRCLKSFSYINLLNGDNIEQNENGFLSGLTDGVLNDFEVVKCSENISFTGRKGTVQYLIDFGTDIGLSGINYTAGGVPDKFEIEWDGDVVSTGYVGSSRYNQALINAGVDISEINTANPPNGVGRLVFDKTSANPTTAKLTVTAPLDNTGWSLWGICPGTIVENVENIASVNRNFEVIDTIPNSPRLWQLGDEVIFGNPLQGNDEIEIIISYDISTLGDGASTLFYTKNNQDVIVKQLAANSGTIDQGSFVLNIKANDVIVIKKKIEATIVGVGALNGGYIRYEATSLQVRNGNYDSFGLFDFSASMQLGTRNSNSG